MVGQVYEKEKCLSCGKDVSKTQIERHNRVCNGRGPRAHRLAKTTCIFCGKKYDNPLSLGGHVSSCKLNPNFEKRMKKMSLAGIGRKIDKSTKIRISISMKKAHAEGRAHNIGSSRWNNKPSYPESFFKKVIENEGIDAGYKTEYPVGIYSIDFAWCHKKIAVEIDGQQHQRFEEYKNRDNRKDLHLKSLGWKVYRIPWIDFFNNTKAWIGKIKSIINSAPIIL